MTDIEVDIDIEKGSASLDLAFTPDAEVGKPRQHIIRACEVEQVDGITVVEEKQ